LASKVQGLFRKNWFK